MTSGTRRKLRRIEHPGHGRYLTFSCYRRLPLFLNDRIKDAFVDRLALTKTSLGFRLYAWVIMPEHVHLVLQTDQPELTAETILHSLKRHFSRKVLARWRELDAAILPRIRDARGQLHFWQTGGGYDRNLTSEAEWREKIEYTHNNPVRRGLVMRPEEWRWSSSRWYEGDQSWGAVIDPL